MARSIQHPPLHNANIHHSRHPSRSLRPPPRRNRDPRLQIRPPERNMVPLRRARIPSNRRIRAHEPRRHEIILPCDRDPISTQEERQRFAERSAQAGSNRCTRGAVQRTRIPKRTRGRQEGRVYYYERSMVCQRGVREVHGECDARSIRVHAFVVKGEVRGC